MHKDQLIAFISLDDTWLMHLVGCINGSTVYLDDTMFMGCHSLRQHQNEPMIVYFLNVIGMKLSFQLADYDSSPDTVKQ